MTLLLFQSFITPTPTPTALSGNEIANITRDVANSALSVAIQGGALAVLALMIIAFVVYLILWRNRGNEVGQALLTTSKLNERMDKRIEDLETEVGTKNQERDNHLTDALTAFSDSNNRIADLTNELKTLLMQMNTRDGHLQQIIEQMGSVGSPAVQKIGQQVEYIIHDPDHSLAILHGKVDSMHKMLEEIKREWLDCKEIKKVVEENPVLLNRVADLERSMDIVKTTLKSGVEEERHKSKPIPAVTVDPQEGTEAA